MTSDPRNWSDKKQWIMGIVGTLVVAGLVALANWTLTLFNSSDVYLTTMELEVHNEWVLLVAYADSEEQALEKSNDFKKVYEASGQTLWSNNILAVRDPRQEGRWLVVVDTWPERSSEKEVKRALEQMRRTDRATQDTLGTWLLGAKPIDWRLDEFARTYGKPINMPTGDRLTKAGNSE